MSTNIVYIGKDPKTEKRLSDICESLDYTFRIFPTVDITPSFPKENCIVLVDGDISSIIETTHLESWKDNSVFRVLLCNRAEIINILENKDLQGFYDDILLKVDDLSLLKKKLRLYQTASQHKCWAEKKLTCHELCKKNQTLTNHVVHLQGQLTQVGTNLKLQEQVIDKIHYISQLSRQINCLDLEKIAAVCINQIPSLISARFASLYTLDMEKGILHLLKHNHPYSIAHTIELKDNPHSPMAKAIEQRKLLLIQDFNEWSHSKGQNVTRKFFRNYRSNSCVIAPLLSGDKIPGVLNLADKIDDNYFDAKIDLLPVQLLCDIIGSAMSNIELYEEVQERARTDSMTRLLNHRSFYAAMKKEVNRARRYGNILSLIMIDLDKLKEINDNLGHQAGDAALMHVTKKIYSCLRETDIAARYGGDEFAIILPNTSLADAMIVAKRLSYEVSHDYIEFGDATLNTTVSVGVGQYQQGRTVEEFMNETDGALFEAKSAGKNRIRVGGEEAANDPN